MATHPDDSAAAVEPLTSAQVAPADSTEEVEVPAPKPTRSWGRAVVTIAGCLVVATLAAAAALSRRAREPRLAAAPTAKQPVELYGDVGYAHQTCDCSWASGGPHGSCAPRAADDQPCWRSCCRSFIGEGGYEGGRFDDRLDGRGDGDRFDGDRFNGRYAGSGPGDRGGYNRGSGRPYPGWGEEDFECEDFEEGEWVRVKNGLGGEDFRDAQIVERRGRSLYEVRFHGGFRKTVSCRSLEPSAHPIWQSFLSLVLFLLAILCCVGIAMGVIQFIKRNPTRPMTVVHY